MKASSLVPLYLLGGFTAFILIRSGALQKIAAGAVQAVGEAAGQAAAGTAQGVGQAIGIPATSRMQCQMDIQNDDGFSASINCPAAVWWEFVTVGADAALSKLAEYPTMGP